MNELWEQIDPGFLAPIWLLVGLFAVVAVALLELGASRRRRQAIALFAAPSLVPGLTGSVSRVRRLIKRFLLISAVGLLFIAMARPHLFFRWSEETRTGLDLFLAVDCSKSMLTEDVKPNRLERAKLAIEDFAEQVPNNRLGLVAFAGDSFLECPLTLDHDAFLTAVRELDTDTIPRPGTDVSSAIDEAVVALKSQPNNLKFMILITDGEDLEGRAISSAKNAAQAGLKIYTVGVGTAEGGMIPEGGDSGPAVYHQDGNGQTVTSKLDESTLRQVADLTGGAYEPLGQHGEGLENIYDRHIATLPKQNLEERREKIRYEWFEWPLALAVLFLICEFLLRDRARPNWRENIIVNPARPMGRRRAVSVPVAVTRVVLAGLLLSTSMEVSRATAPATTAEKDYKAGQFGDAAQKYGEAVQQQPDSQALQYDRGDAAYKAGGFNEAEDAFRKALETPDLNLQENTYYNLGNTQFKHGEAMEKDDSKRARELWEQSLHSYESALKLKDAADTRHNYEIVKKKLEELKRQQQKQQQQQQGNQQKKDQQQSGQNSQPGQGNPGDQKQGQENSQNGQDPSQQQGGEQPQNEAGNNGPDKSAQQQPTSDKNAPQRQQARSGGREQDKQDPGVKNREEAEALLDSLKDDEHRVTARSLYGNNEPPPPPSGKDW